MISQPRCRVQGLGFEVWNSGTTSLRVKLGFGRCMDERLGRRGQRSGRRE